MGRKLMPISQRRSETLTTRISPRLRERLDLYCETHELSATEVLRVALAEYLADQGKKVEK